MNRRWSALALIVTAQFMVILDVAIVNVALPSIKSDLGFSQTNLQWVISAYAILFGGVLLAPAALSLLMTTFAEGRERNLALGIYGAASGSGAAAGVLLGGLLTSYLSWSWIFFIPGSSSITAGLMLLVYAMTRATSDGWGADTTLAFLGGAVDLVLAFVDIELRSPSPLLPLRIFRLRTLASANVAMAIVGAVAFSEFFLLTLYLQDVLHYSAVESGAAFVSFALAVVVIS